MNCNEKCSENCINKETCDHVSGVCPSECQDGFVGAYCNKCKILFQSFHFISVLQIPLTKTIIKVQSLTIIDFTVIFQSLEIYGNYCLQKLTTCLTHFVFIPEIMLYLFSSAEFVVSDLSSLQWRIFRQKLFPKMPKLLYTEHLSKQRRRVYLSVRMDRL